MKPCVGMREEEAGCDIGMAKMGFIKRGALVSRSVWGVTSSVLTCMSSRDDYRAEVWLMFVVGIGLIRDTVQNREMGQNRRL